MSARDLEISLTIPAELNERIHDLPNEPGDGTLGDKILRLLASGVIGQERAEAENDFPDNPGAKLKAIDLTKLTTVELLSLRAAYLAARRGRKQDDYDRITRKLDAVWRELERRGAAYEEK